MLGSIRKNGILVLASLLIGGCASTQKLDHPITKGSRIGVISNFRDVALFQRAGTTGVDNASFYRRVPGLRMNALVTTAVANDLYRSREYRVFPIYHRTAAELLTTKVSKDSLLTPQYRDFVSRLIRKKKLSKLVLVVPGDIDFGDGQYMGAIWWASGYGLFNRAFIFMHTNTVFSAYRVYVIDTKTYKILAKAKGNLQVRTHGINIAWRKGYAGVNAKTLRAVKNVIRKRMPASLTRVVHKTGLP